MRRAAREDIIKNLYNDKHFKLFCEDISLSSNLQDIKGFRELEYLFEGFYHWKLGLLRGLKNEV